MALAKSPRRMHVVPAPWEGTSASEPGRPRRRLYRSPLSTFLFIAKGLDCSDTRNEGFRLTGKTSTRLTRSKPAGCISAGSRPGNDPVSLSRLSGDGAKASPDSCQHHQRLRDRAGVVVEPSAGSIVPPGTSLNICDQHQHKCGRDHGGRHHGVTYQRCRLETSKREAVSFADRFR
jgi:hypothetical protein